MTIEYICGEAARVTQRYDEHDPLRLARAMKILVGFEPMGTADTACKGFFLSQSGVRHITVNSQLPEALRRIILAHELGHAVLHSDVAKMRAFHDFSLYDSSSQLEYEANLFAAELLLSDDEVAEKLGEDTFFFAAARELRVPPEMLDFKFRILKKKGWQLDSPIVSSGDFLKNMELSEGQ